MTEQCLNTNSFNMISDWALPVTEMWKLGMFCSPSLIPRDKESSEGTNLFISTSGPLI